MAFSFEAPETTAGEGGGLSEPGTYHVVINDAIEGQTSQGKPIDGLTATFEVLAGTVDGQGGKTRTESLFSPSAKDVAKEEKDGTSCMARRKLAALFIAANAMDPNQLGKPVEVDVADLVGQQCVIKFEKQMEMDGEGKYTIPSKYIQISYSDIYHVDDPAVKDVPKSAEALSLIPPVKRHGADWFGWKKKKAPAKRQPVAAATDSGDLW